MAVKDMQPILTEMFNDAIVIFNRKRIARGEYEYYATNVSGLRNVGDSVKWRLDGEKRIKMIVKTLLMYVEKYTSAKEYIVDGWNGDTTKFTIRAGDYVAFGVECLDGVYTQAQFDALAFDKQKIDTTEIKHNFSCAPIICKFTTNQNYQ